MGETPEAELREVEPGSWGFGPRVSWQAGRTFDLGGVDLDHVVLPSLEAWAAFDLARALEGRVVTVTVPGWAPVLVASPTVERATVEEALPTALEEPQARATTRSTVQGPDLRILMKEYGKLLRWGRPADNPERMSARSAIVSLIGSEEGAASELAAAEARASAFLSGLDGLKRLLKRDGPGAPEVIESAEELRRAFPEGGHAVQKELEWSANVREKNLERQELRRQGGALTTVKPGPALHYIHALPPSASWTVVIDETGPFEGATNQSGVLAALVFPQGVRLPPLPPLWHAAFESPRSVDQAVQRVLDAPVGILALRGHRPDWVEHDPWASAVLGMMDAILRLLPLPPSGRVRVDVFIEQRGTHNTQASWQAAWVQLYRNLRRSDRARADALDAWFHFATKGTGPLAYADAVAFTFGSPSNESKARCREARLRDYLSQCDTESYERLLSAATRTTLSPEEWRLALADDIRMRPPAVQQALDRLAVWCGERPDRWAGYLAAAAAHAESKAVDRRRLGREVAWLRASRPAGSTLPGVLDLEAQIVALQELAHRGDWSRPQEAEIALLARALSEEAPDRACQADLVLAVVDTNRFRFEDASARLRPWEAEPSAVPGLRHHARVLSSLGQHGAFRGDSQGAIRYFEAALSAFARLSDPAVGAAERSHTVAYRAVAAQDADLGSSARLALRDYAALLIPMPDSDPGSVFAQVARGVAGDPSPRLHYLHHILLRGLWQLGTAAERSEYVDLAPSWATGEGHPWPLIEGYRALLLVDRDLPAAEQHAAQAEELASTADQGPTVRFIGLVLNRVFRAAGLPDRFDAGHYAAEFVALREALPDAPWRVLDGPSRDPAALLIAGLPFNFR